MILDNIGQPYLIQAVTDHDTTTDLQSGILQQWLWQGGQWQSGDNLDLRGLPVLRPDTLAAAVTGDGRLAAAYVAQESGEALPELLFFTNRTLPPLEVTATPLPTLTPTPTPTPTATATTTPEPTPAIVFPTEAGSGGLTLPVLGTLAGNRIIIVGAILALLPVGLVTLLVLILRTRSNRH